MNLSMGSAFGLWAASTFWRADPAGSSGRRAASIVAGAPVAKMGISTASRQALVGASGPSGRPGMLDEMDRSEKAASLPFSQHNIE